MYQYCPLSVQLSCFLFGMIWYKLRCVCCLVLHAHVKYCIADRIHKCISGPDDESPKLECQMASDIQSFRSELEGDQNHNYKTKIHGIPWNKMHYLPVLRRNQIRNRSSQQKRMYSTNTKCI